MRRICLAFITTILIVFISKSLQGQQERIDSMEQILDTASIKVRASTLTELAWAYRNINPGRGIRLGNEALELLFKLGDRTGEAECLMYIGVCYYILNDLDHSMDFYFRSMKIREELNDQEGIAAILNNLGNISKEMANYPKAIEYYQQTKTLGQDLGNKKTISTALANLAVCYRLLNELDTALKYNLEALRIREEIGDKRGVGGSLNNIAVIYADSAFHGKDLNVALDYFERSLRIKEDLGDEAGICQTLINMGQLRADLGQFSSSKIYLDQALSMARELGVTNLLMVAYAHLADFYDRTGDYKKAFEYQVIYTNLMDSVYIEDNKQQMAEMEVRYETQKKEQENELLKQQSVIQALQIIRQRNLRNSFIILTVMLLGLAIALFSRFYLKKKTNRLLEEKNKQLAILNATKDKFFSIIAHDLKNPLGVLLQVSGQLKERFSELNDQQKLQIISLISSSSVQTHNLLANLLEWSVSQTGNVPSNPEQLDLAGLVDSNFELLKLNADKKEVRLVSEIPGNTMVLADRHMIGTVLRNLLSNAIKFMLTPGEVRVSCTDLGKMMEVRVKDEGIGISNEDIGQLFRIDVNSARIGGPGEKGTGLGLILCKEFVEKNGGTIRAESVTGSGSTFIFTLPKAGSI
jgi:signal transduction histidine kinase